MTYQLFPIGPTERVHDDFAFEQWRAQSAKLADGGAIVVWFDTRDTSNMGTFSDNAVMARRYDSDGNPVGPERIVAEVDNYLRPVVTGLEGGGYVIGWLDDGLARFALFDAADAPVQQGALSAPTRVHTLTDGTTVTADTEVSSSSAGSLFWDLTSLDTGGFAFTWTAAHGRTASLNSASNSFTQTFDSAGDPLGTPVALGPWASSPAGQTSVTTVGGAMLEDGKYALLIRLSPDDTERDSISVAVRVFNEDGTPAGEPVLLDPDTPGNQYASDIATLADGSLVATWYTSAWIDEGGGAKLRRLGEDGTPLDAAVRIEGGSSSSAWITPMEDGGWLVSWHMAVPPAGGRAYMQRAQRYDAEGNTVGDVTQIASVRSDPDRSDFGITGFAGPGDFIALEGGPLFGLFNGYVGDSPEDGPQRGDHDVFVRLYAPEVLGSVGDDVLEAGATGTALYGLEGNDTLIGGPGDDFLIGGPGDDLLLGGGGTNMAVFSGRPADYDITRGPDGRLTVTDLREDSPDGTDTLENIALLQFSGRGTFDRETVAVADLELDVTLSGQVTTAQGQPMEGVTLTLMAEGWPDQTATSDAGGMFGFSLANGIGARLEAARDHDPATDGRPTAMDALEVLRLAVGLNPSFGPAQAQTFIAADMNGDGTITAQDALEVLRAAVGLASDNAPRWVFVDAATDWEALEIARSNVQFDTGIAIAAGDSDLDLGLTGILLGNMAEV